MDIANLTRKFDLTEGHWIDEIPNHPNVRLCVRSTNYKPFRVATAGMGRRRTKQLQTDEGLVDFSILLDWEGVTSGDKPVKYDPKVAMAILTADDDLGIGQSFRMAVEWSGDQVADLLAKQTDEAAGN